MRRKLARFPRSALLYPVDMLPQQCLDIPQPSSPLLAPLPFLLSKSRRHEFSLLGLDVEDAFFDGICRRAKKNQMRGLCGEKGERGKVVEGEVTFDDESEDCRCSLLSEAVDAIDGLVFDCGRPPAVG